MGYLRLMWSSAEHQNPGPHSESLQLFLHDFGSMQPRSLSSPQSVVLDTGIFRGLKELFDEDLLSETYRTFLMESRERLRSLHGKFEERPFRELGHTLRGSAGMLGAPQVAVFATLLEHLTPGSEGMADALTALSNACDALERALREQGVKL